MLSSWGWLFINSWIYHYLLFAWLERLKNQKKNHDIYLIYKICNILICHEIILYVYDLNYKCEFFIYNITNKIKDKNYCYVWAFYKK